MGSEHDVADAPPRWVLWSHDATRVARLLVSTPARMMRFEQDFRPSRASNTGAAGAG